MLKVSVAADEVAGRIESAIDDALRHAKLPGFRPGKIPRRVIVERYGPAITNEIVQEVLQEAYKQALTEAAIEPLSPGEMQDVQFEKGNPLSFTVKVEIPPELTLPVLSEITVELQKPDVAEEDVALALNNLRESQASLAPTEEPIDLESVVTVDVQEVDAGGFPIVGRSRKDLQIDLPKQRPDDEVAQRLIGLKADQSTIVDVTDAPGASGQRPKSSRLQFTVKNVQRKELPAIDDAFAKSVNPQAENLEAMKADLKRYLEARAYHKAREQMFRSVVDELLRRTDFAVPPRMLEHYLDDLAHNALHGHDHEHNHKHDEHEHDSEEVKKFKEQYRASAIWNLRWQLLRRQLIKEYNLDVSDDEFQAELERLSAFDGRPRKQYEKDLTDEQKRQIREDLMERKVLAVLEQQVQVIPRPISLAEFEGRGESKLVTV
jgi:trigger factor